LFRNEHFSPHTKNVYSPPRTMLHPHKAAVVSHMNTTRREACKALYFRKVRVRKVVSAQAVALLFSNFTGSVYLNSVETLLLLLLCERRPNVFLLY
jgi:hypothetical protein